MDEDLRRSTLRYYDERAAEYEEAYLRGTGTSSISDPGVFQREAAHLTGIVERCARGRLLDLGCGTGYWLPYYASRCSWITLIDQSPRMLDQCRTKVAVHGVADRTDIVQGDVLDHPFSSRAYDSVLVGFLLSHLTVEEERRLFEVLRHVLDAAGRFIILDSAHSPERARVNAKIERQARRLNDGTRFEIYKRYLDRDDATRWAATYAVALDVLHFGAAFLAVSGEFVRAS